MRAFSLSADGIEPVSSSASIFSAIVLPTPGELVRAALRAPARRRTRRPRGSPWRRCGRRPRGGRSRRRARTGSPARRRPRLSRRCASAARVRAPWPAPGSSSPPTTRPRTSSRSCAAVLPQLAAPGTSTPSWSSTTTRPTARARSPTGWPRETAQVEVLHRPQKEGLGPRLPRGLRARARGAAPSWCCEMDADFSHDPADLPRLIAAAGAADLVLGSRYVPGGGVENWGLVPPGALARRLRLRAAGAGRAGARPDRRLQVLSPARAREASTSRGSTPTATASRSS